MFATILVAAFHYLALWTLGSVALVVGFGVWGLSRRLRRPGQEPPARPGDME